MTHHWCQASGIRCTQYSSDSPMILSVNDQGEYSNSIELSVDYCPICGYNRDMDKLPVWRGELGLHSEPYMKNMKMLKPNHLY